MPVKLLSIENHASLASVLREMILREPGLELVGEAGSAATALELLPQVEPDAVILDINLPDMCGLEVIPLILAQLPSTRVILLTSHDDPRYQQAAAEKGACACIRKELIATCLIPAVKQSLAR